MTRAATTILALLALGACKGRAPNYLRVDLPMAGQEFGPGEPTPEGGYALAFHDTFLFLAEAGQGSITLTTYREDGREEGTRTLIEPGEDAWDIGAERIASLLGDEALAWEGQDAVEACLAEGPKKTKTSIVLLPGGLARLGDRWALAYSALTSLTCEGGKRRVAAIDRLALFDDGWEPVGDPALVRYGPAPEVHAVALVGGEPALAWSTSSGAGISRPGSVLPVTLEKGALDYPPIFRPAGESIAVVTRPSGRIRARLVDADEATEDLDVTIDPGKTPLSVAAAWTGDRLGVFFGLDRAEGVSSLLQHILVEIFPDGTVSQPTKVYTQYSMAEDTSFTKCLCATWADGRYGLAWIADDGYSQDLYLQEIPTGAKEVEKKAWRRDFREGFRALKGVTLFATPPQYVLHYLTVTSATTHRHSFFLTALPTQR